nr:hypothetical protein [Tanacetum cinerariifolium]
SQVSESSKKDLEDLFQDFYGEYFDSSKIMKSSTTNVETSINEEAFHEVSESFQGESSSSSLNDDVQQGPEEVIPFSLELSNILIVIENITSTSEHTKELDVWFSLVYELIRSFSKRLWIIERFCVKQSVAMPSAQRNDGREFHDETRPLRSSVLTSLPNLRFKVAFVHYRDALSVVIFLVQIHL